ncbi:MAG: translocation/assembly module TamB domain-containing protein [Rhodobacteraceae bacterium]|nr:translocation/assembly module TamB domain-containing protein [Paracoccaceae bacterium]
MRRIALALTLVALPLSAIAQDAETTERDRDFLTGFLEDNLSSLGRTVRIDGFKGALSSRATFDQLSIADGDGVWLTIKGGAIGWNRSALLSGRVEISEMSAAEIDLPRRPVGGGAGAEASGFSLPELPVSVDIGKLSAGRVVLGEALFGAAAEVSLQGTMHLEGGEGTTDLTVDRIDGKEGRVALTGSYANATRKATLDLLVAEGKDGIAANMLGLPGTPSIELAVHGDGVIDDFQTDIVLQTDGAPRLTGQVTLVAVPTEGATPERQFRARLSGDIAPLLQADYRAFIGSNVALEADGRRLPSGRLDLSRLVLSSRGFDLTGRVSLDPAGLPLQAALTARLGLGDAGEVLLPIPGPRTFVRAGDLRLRYDQTRGQGWSLDGTLHGFRRADLRIGAVALDGSGRIAVPGQGGVKVARAGGTVTFDAQGIEPAAAALAQAIGPSLAGKAIFDWTQDGPLRLPSFDVAGQGYGASGTATVKAPVDGSGIEGRVTAEVADLSRFSALAGRDLGGSGTVEVSGSGGLLSGLFDGEARITGRDLTAGQAELDRLLKGESRLEASLLRDTTGITIRRLNVTASTLSAQATGKIGQDSAIDATLDFTDLSVLGQGYRGRLTGSGSLREADGVRRYVLDGEGRGLGIGQAEIDRVLSGTSTLHVEANEAEGRVRLDKLVLTNPQLRTEAQGRLAGGERRIDLSARLADMALLVPGFGGPLSAEGTVREGASGYVVDLAGTGPGATSARITGEVAADGKTASLALTGTGQSAIVNPFIEPRSVQGPVSFDLKLDGPLGLASLTGQASLDGGRFVAPTFGIELDGVSVVAALAGGRAMLSGSAGVKGGGAVSISGPVSLTAPYDGSLAVELKGARLRDPDLYDTTVSGTVRLEGPVTGGALIAGAVALGPTEIRVPSSGYGTAPVLDGLTHVNEGPQSRETRARAGLLQDRGNAGPRGPAYALDLTISAPERLFVRGRGLDAEMGGTLVIGGTTDNVIPSGSFKLIRGRLDLLGKRFTIDEGIVELQGALTPYIRFAAVTESDGITATILIEGAATEPQIRFESSPELPEEEVIAQILFGRNLTELSPLQAAQLASAVATLAGKGGEGIIGNLRKTFGLDDFDVTTGEDGNAALRVGKYLSDKVYTDVTVGSDGKSEINLNLDVNKSLTARGTLGSDGSTGVGVYWERDY